LVTVNANTGDVILSAKPLRVTPPKRAWSPRRLGLRRFTAAGSARAGCLSQSFKTETAQKEQSPFPTARFFDSEKQKTDPPPDFKIFRNRNTHLYLLVRELTPGNGSIERHG
jgi:hypothetical protein